MTISVAVDCEQGTVQPLGVAGIRRPGPAVGGSTGPGGDERKRSRASVVSVGGLEETMQWITCDNMCFSRMSYTRQTDSLLLSGWAW